MMSTKKKRWFEDIDHKIWGEDVDHTNNNVNNIEVQQEIIQNIEDINAYDGDEIEVNISNGAQQELLHNIAKMNVVSY